MIAISGTSNQSCRLVEVCKLEILKFFHTDTLQAITAFSLPIHLVLCFQWATLQWIALMLLCVQTQAGLQPANGCKLSLMHQRRPGAAAGTSTVHVSETSRCRIQPVSFELTGYCRCQLTPATTLLSLDSHEALRACSQGVSRALTN